MTVREFPKHPFIPGVKNRKTCDYNYPVGGCTMTEREHDIAMMVDPNAWPSWPILPLKRYSLEAPIGLDCGFIAEQPRDSTEIIIYHGTMFEVRETVMNENKHLRYDSWDAVYDDGWRVD